MTFQLILYQAEYRSIQKNPLYLNIVNTLTASGNGNILNELNVYETLVSYIIIVCGLPTSKSFINDRISTLNKISAGFEIKATPSNFLPYTI